MGRYYYLFGERVLGEENDMPRTTRLIMEELGAVLGRSVPSFGVDMEKALGEMLGEKLAGNTHKALLFF